MGKKITSILIANRGEIALRVIRACRELGIKSIAVYSDEDVRAVHVKRADEAYHIGPAAPAQSYLNMAKIVETAKAAGADAIHPGYGFLSENENFPELCDKNGMIFIGPTAKAMDLTGDKMKCKAVMKKAKVPTVPGSDGIVSDVEKAADIAHEAGYPVLLKSAFGGGGRGIRLANDEKQLRQEFEMASAESKAAFGKSALFVEKYLQRIRHIEFQLIRDSHGNGRHLFERECSVQRRHQKLIEMSPSPVVDQKTRERIGEIAVRAAAAVDYLNAGTAEFLRDPEGNFYFIEINSRLQVEHPVTELVTGLDLVKLQVAVAQGEEIPFKQEDLKMNGCAIECRVNAEDPFYDFAPSVGPVPYCNIPYGPGVRVDTYLYPGCTVSGFYDSLVAKLLTWGRNFDEARVRMRNALDEFVIEGINTTIPLYKTIMDEKNFIKGELSTDYLERFKVFDRMNEESKKEAEEKASAAVAAALLHSELVKKGAPAKSSGWKQARVNL
ncbi:MAG: acetyl-CoA carboxylase biotin carboxylase subunit [Nitrososphaera sp.]|uniref:acetyl-CoA carboxylase biotin carboxylase subunit n=2 Tax=Nitrososphaera sp. TaxID=1971748 RepID=UPI0017EE901E|nr:acetyl-CoA carboxylase biotin carboxylase subunit [Nitrososphaera sp.]NWG37799.1 acetyl-CoA carboxylase biotin carboxylase subunit [Nitrososphaera sp.]